MHSFPGSFLIPFPAALSPYCPSSRFLYFFVSSSFSSPLVLTIKDSSGDSFKQIFVIHQNVSSFFLHPFSKLWSLLLFFSTGFFLPQRNLKLWSFQVCIVRFFPRFSSSSSSSCPQITPWSQKAEGCIFSFHPATSSREPAAPGWWSSCRGCDDSSSSWSSSGSVTGCCCWGSPVGGEAGQSGMNGGRQRPLLMMKCPWI